MKPIWSWQTFVDKGSVLTLLQLTRPTIERDSVEKGSYRFLSKIEHCQNNSKFLCLGVLNNALSFFLLDFALFSRYKVCKKTSVFLAVSDCRMWNKRNVSKCLVGFIVQQNKTFCFADVLQSWCWLTFFAYFITQKWSKIFEKKTGHNLIHLNKPACENAVIHCN